MLCEGRRQDAGYFGVLADVRSLVNAVTDVFTDVRSHDHADGHADVRSHFDADRDADVRSHAVPIYGDPIGCADDVQAVGSSGRSAVFDVVKQLRCSKPPPKKKQPERRGGVDDDDDDDDDESIIAASRSTSQLAVCDRQMKLNCP
jgi:hypothetical protein